MLLALAIAAPCGTLAEPLGNGVLVVPGFHDAAARRVSVAVIPGVVRTIDLPTEGLRQARRDLLAGLPMLDADLRALAEQQDGLAAQRYVRRLLEADPRGSDSDIAYFGSIAAATGRVWSLPDAVDAMRRLDPATEPAERIRLYADMLYAHAWAGNSLALDTVIELNGEGRLFGPLSPATRARILEQGERSGDGRVALRMALVLLESGSLSDEATAQARDYLARAQAGNSLAVQVMATTLLARLEQKAEPEEVSP